VCRQVCKTWRRIINTNEFIWENVAYRHSIVKEESEKSYKGICDCNCFVLKGVSLI
jgi:hypothetical protein